MESITTTRVDPPLTIIPRKKMVIELTVSNRNDSLFTKQKVLCSPKLLYSEFNCVRPTSKSFGLYLLIYPF
jgi:hypothetical protein